MELTAYVGNSFCMKEDLNNITDNLIHDPEFLEWVLRPTKESDQYWAQFISDHPSRKKEMDDAISLIKSLVPQEKELTEESIFKLWNRIDNSVKSKKNGIRHLHIWMAAASIILLFGISGLLYFQLKSDNTGINYQSIAKADLSSEEVKLIFADKSEEVLRSKDLNIKYSTKGEIEVNSANQPTEKIQEQPNDADQLNQLIVPRGKRTNLTLSDGTKLFLNSGSRAIFPVIFTKKEREIFIEGEAYLEVAHNENKPFFVVTNKIRVRVLGTKFNVSAYPEDNAVSVVLVEGSVQAIVDSKKVMMVPNQLLTYEKNSGETTLNETDVLRYTSWKDGWMYCEKEKLETIATKLSRYYDVKIEFTDKQLMEMTLTGKLDLKTECSDVIKAISSTAPILFEIQDNVIVISKKNS